MNNVHDSTGMEKRLTLLERTVQELLTTTQQPCSGCAALSERVAELERRLDGPTGLVETQSSPTGAAAGDEWEAGESLPDCADAVDFLLREATAEEADPVDVLLREAEQLGAGVFDEDIKELLSDITTPPTTGYQLEVATPSTPVPVATAPTPAVDITVSRCHLILGDSIAKHLKLPVPPGDSVLNLAEGGNTWLREKQYIRDHLEEWEAERLETGDSRGSIFIWMGGNDIYGRPERRPQGLDHEAIRSTISEAKAQGRVSMAGPTVRLWKDDGAFWEQTPAFQADRILAEVAQQEGVRFVAYLGRSMTVMRRNNHTKRHVVDGALVARYFSDRLGIHLGPEGYDRVLNKLHDIFHSKED